MWLAICTAQQCQWDRVASSQAQAELAGLQHQFDRQGHWNHRVQVVEIPAASPAHPAPTFAT